MNFYERYTCVCRKRGVDPCAQSTAEMFGTTRSAISSWGTKGIVPKGTTVAKIADALDTSTDYLLGRTDDISDYTKNTPIHNIQTPDFLKDYNRLDDMDQAKVDGIMQGLLLSDKYKNKKHQNLA